jgi:hypothetical protein
LHTLANNYLKSYLDFGLQFDVINYSIGKVLVGFVANPPVDRRWLLAMFIQCDQQQPSLVNPSRSWV